ncbi:hypothetical protein NESM_000328900 [Novymonas esmeraldas]|uniref:Transmembrane protein n=1 Tax=Novymonas esmeraldas TaxID=1808958 RepID=A0AAW0EJ99_9TRYP
MDDAAMEDPHVVKDTGPTTTTTLAPSAGTTSWSVDSAMIWLVPLFYVAIVGTAFVCFIVRWRRRMYGADRTSSLGTDAGGGDADGGAAAAAANANRYGEGLLATIAAMIDGATSKTALAGVAAWQRADNRARHRSSSPSPGPRHRGGGHGQGWLSGLASFFNGTQSRPTTTSKRAKQRGDDGHPDTEATTAPWLDGGAATAGGTSAVPSSSIAATLTARDQPQQQQ